MLDIESGKSKFTKKARLWSRFDSSVMLYDFYKNGKIKKKEYLAKIKKTKKVISDTIMGTGKFKGCSSGHINKVIKNYLEYKNIRKMDLINYPALNEIIEDCKLMASDILKRQKNPDYKSNILENGVRKNIEMSKKSTKKRKQSTAQLRDNYPLKF